VDQRSDVLLVPNAALRWKPSAEQIAPEIRTVSRSAKERQMGNRSTMMPQGGQTRMTESQMSLFRNILSKYDSKNFSEADFETMTQELREAGIGRTREAKSVLDEAGFNIERYVKNVSSDMGRSSLFQKEHVRLPVSTSEIVMADTGNRGIIWIQQGEFVRPVNVTTGITDGIHTEVHGDGVKEGMEIVIGAQAEPQKGPRGEIEKSNPFMPDLPSRKGGPPR
jgi:hypothetical protein